MTDMAGATRGHGFSTAAQVVVGLILGPVVVWALWQGLPIRSGLGVFATSVAITLAAAVVVALGVRALRSGAVAFAISSTLLNLLVGSVVVAI